MPYTFDAAAAPLIPAKDYLARFRNRGRPVHLKHLGLSFYGISNCLCLGAEVQAVGPVETDGRLSCLFTDACPYPANEQHLAPIASGSLAQQHMVTDVEEAVPLFPPGAPNLWHFTTESLPKVLALESIGYAGSYIVPARTGGPDDDVIAESLEICGIAPKRLLKSGPLYHVRRLMLPQRLKGFDLAENQVLTDFLRSNLINAVGEQEGGRRLYVRRVGRRRILNEDELLAALADFDFETMTPEELSLADEWRAMTNVECSLMAHGANTALVLLQKPASGFIELFSNRYVSYTNLHAVRLLRLRYHALVQELEFADFFDVTEPVNNFVREGFTADILADVPHARILLENLTRRG